MTVKPPRNAWLALTPLVALVAFFLGQELRSDAVTSFDYDLGAPSYEVAAPASGVSKGGFTGFDQGAGLDGETVLSGRVTAVTVDSLVVQTESGASVPIRLSGDGPLRRIEPVAMSALRSGMTVTVRTASDSGEATGILIISTP